MNSQIITLDFLSLEVPAHWDNVSHSREGDERILRLHKNTSYWSGLIQVKAKRYRWSNAPKASLDKLLKDLIAFAEDYIKRWIGNSRQSAYDQMKLNSEGIKLVAASFDVEDDVAEIDAFLRIWQVSDGRHFAYVIYKSEDWHESRRVRQHELKECESVVRSIVFKKR